MVLLLDALNEMPHRDRSDYRERIGPWKRFVQELADAGSGNRVVFSCRSLDYSTPLSTPLVRVPQVRVEPMTDEAVRAFLSSHSPGGAEALWRELCSAHVLEALRWPFHLRLLTDEYSARSELPRGRAGLFTGFVRRALRRELEIAQRTYSVRTNSLALTAAREEGGVAALQDVAQARILVHAAEAAGWTVRTVGVGA